MQPYRMELSEFKITQNDPIHPLVLKLMLDNLQYRYDNPKLKDNNWNFKNEKYDIDFHRITNDNGKYVAIYCWKSPTELPLILAMVKVYDKTKTIRILAENCMETYNLKQDEELYNAILKAIDYRHARKN